MTALQQVGWHVAPAASPWPSITEIHADRWWSPHLLDTARISLPTGHGLGQRLQVAVPPEGDGPPAHHILAATGVLPLAELTPLLLGWPAPTSPDQPPPP